MGRDGRQVWKLPPVFPPHEATSSCLKIPEAFDLATNILRSHFALGEYSDWTSLQCHFKVDIGEHSRSWLRTLGDIPAEPGLYRAFLRGYLVCNTQPQRVKRAAGRRLTLSSQMHSRLRHGGNWPVCREGLNSLYSRLGILLASSCTGMPRECSVAVRGCHATRDSRPCATNRLEYTLVPQDDVREVKADSILPCGLRN